MKYLTKEQILLVHSIAIDESGGAHGVRDFDAILSLEILLAQKAFGKELYKGVFVKAALYARNIIMSHPFIDGNKRTGIISASVFLELNDYFLAALDGEVENFAVRIVTEKLDINNIADWLKRNSKKAKR
ncbi:MAG TPA: type II toxin-antitoxin system death-on-curing family toxin [Candidatus Yonathbacteria bacterium]|nr:type II toxin-antitoxin system death-on-curing family toxin [Candidatus Yonathbacteria bacterium]